MRKNGKLIIGGMAAVAFALATPAMAHGGRGHDNGHWNQERYWQGHAYGYGHAVRERVVVREYVRPMPVYPRVAYPVYPAYVAPGIHVVLPSIYIPLR